MNIVDYQAAVIAYFKSGKATDEQWQIIGELVLNRAENDGCEEIDRSILSPQDFVRMYGEEPTDE
jgi:hypothetical protein